MGLVIKVAIDSSGNAALIVTSSSYHCYHFDFVIAETLPKISIA